MKGVGANALANQMVDPQTGKMMWRGRMPKPAFKYLGTTAVVVPASSVAPIHLNIGGNIYTVTSNMECNATISGVGGLLRGGSLEAATIYYLYAVAQDGTPYLVMDRVPPTEGIGEATYIGSFATEESTSALISFVSYGGEYRPYKCRIQQVSHTGDTSWTDKTIRVPTTSRTTIGMLIVVGANANQAVEIRGGTSGPSNGNFSIYCQVANIENSAGFEVAMETVGTIQIRTAHSGNTVYWRHMGWIEDPSEYA